MSLKITSKVIKRQNLKRTKIKISGGDDAIGEWASGKQELDLDLPNYLPVDCEFEWEENFEKGIFIILSLWYPPEKEAELRKKMEDYSEKHVFSIPM